MSTFHYGIFVFTKLERGCCRVGEGDGFSSLHGNGLIERTSTKETTIIIPAFVKDSSGNLYKVTETNVYCFRGCNSIKNVTLPDTLQYIGRDTLFQTSVESLIIPASVEELDGAAFSHMTYCKSLIFQPGSKIKELKLAVFASITNVKEIIIPPSVVKMDRPFYNCAGAKNVYFCGTTDMSNVDVSMTNMTGSTIFVTSNYPQGATFGGYQVQIDDKICLPYLYYRNKMCTIVINYGRQKIITYYLISLLSK